VISAVVIPRSLPTNEELTITEPVRNEFIATAMVTDKTNNASWNVELKHSGRAFGSCIGGDSSAVELASSDIVRNL
jgi:hypothetical protein